MRPKLHFFDLPLEVRLEIYRHCFSVCRVGILPDYTSPMRCGFYRNGHELLYVSRQIREEARAVYSFDLAVLTLGHEWHDHFPPHKHPAALRRTRHLLCRKKCLADSQTAIPVLARNHIWSEPSKGITKYGLKMVFLIVDDESPAKLEFKIVFVEPDKPVSFKRIASPFTYADNEGFIRQIQATRRGPDTHWQNWAPYKGVYRVVYTCQGQIQNHEPSKRNTSSGASVSNDSEKRKAKKGEVSKADEKDEMVS